MSYLKKYTIQKNRLKKAALIGMELTDREKLQLEPQTVYRSLFLPVLDSAEDDTKWGRLYFMTELSGMLVIKIHAAASNEKNFVLNGNVTEISSFLTSREIDPDKKKELLDRMEEIEFTDKSDCLLYTLKGRYLYICIEVFGLGEGTISKIGVNIPGDNFMHTFPEIYQEWGGFFHRYLSVFSSIYNDMQDDAENLPELLDVSTAPVELLTLFAGWQGVDISGDFLCEEAMRKLVSEIPWLNRRKGTKQALERITKIVLEEQALIIENARVKTSDITDSSDQHFGLYGNSQCDITILVQKFIEEKRKSQLFFLLNQFIPVRCRLHIVYLDKSSTLNTYCYLDMNAQLFRTKTGKLDEHYKLDDYIMMTDTST